ncbi:serine hydrolase [Phenylobacterium sp.]|uniref:serine hydrolase domain-containing protein n=1 Tax=Phenylobacterium sp. TaxID=1871053 RepID=UPI00121D9325|nr:serine hydrolase domain-containing protein [Phenylobacterium sp.]THD61379.1 MAG: class A beta-lactamase-related serine hydrolase [Phenylobacterium sp.]
MKRFVLAVALAAVSLAPAVAQPPPAAPAAAPVAETPASEQARRLLQAFTTGDDASFLAAIKAIDPNTRRKPEEWLEMRQNLAKLQFHALSQATPTHAEILVYDGDREDWARLVVDVQAEPPHALTAMSIHMARRPDDVPATPKLQPPELIAALKERLTHDAATGDFDGAVLVAQRGKPIFQAAYGEADREHRTPNAVETQFRFGSMGKMFTAIAIMQLAQAGKLDLDAPLGRYLPDYPNAEIAQKVTVNNLLTHSGGTGDIFGPQFDAHRLELRDPKDYVALYGARGPEFPPGSNTSYSNYGFMLLGRIVEAVSGQSYDAYIAQHILAPARMTATGNLPETIKLPKRATGYMGDTGKLKPADDTQPYRGTPAGGGYSTVGDLLRFGDALMDGKLLDAAHLKLLSTGGLTAKDGTFLRYDFSITDGEGRHILGHAGGAPGMNGELRIYPDNSYTVVVLANRDPPAAQKIMKFIGDRLP